MHIRLLRHATLVVSLHGVNLLVDPMLSRAGAMDPVANAANQKRIPLVDLPMTETELGTLLGQIDGVLVTHVHRDHWDAAAIELLPRNIPILCQPENEEAIHKAGFSLVIPIESEYQWRDIKFQRTSGQHGTGEIGKQMGVVSGFVLRAPDEPTLYIAGDTIWCTDVMSVLAKYQPDVVVVNAGAAQFLTGDPITMTAEDVCQVCKAIPTAEVIAVHMEAINHCLLTREALQQAVTHEGVAWQVKIPSDGATINL